MKHSFILLASIVLVLSACSPAPQISSFEECVAAGNPVMESYPRQCAANGQTFVEQLDEPLPEPPVPEPDFVAAEFTACQEPRPEACTMQYDPVCAMIDNGVRCVTEPCASTDAVTMGNHCSACSDESVLGTYAGECEQIRFVVCEEVITGFNITELAEQSGWACVDICPGNYDPYVTQIGATMCIPHYGVEEIEQWPVCERSSDSCNCALAYETTQNQEIADAEYRCVPDHYGERLLFRSGLDRLDETGDRSVMIA